MENGQEQGMPSGQDNTLIQRSPTFRGPQVGDGCSNYPRKMLRRVPEPWVPLHCHHQRCNRVPLHTGATTAATHSRVNGSAAYLSPDTTLQFRVQDVNIALAEGQVVCLRPVCKNGWLGDSVALLASILKTDSI